MAAAAEGRPDLTTSKGVSAVIAVIRRTFEERDASAMGVDVGVGEAEVPLS